MDKQIKILGIGAHGCDVFGRAGGTIARYIKNGHKATIVALTYGERGEAEVAWGQENMTVEKVKELKKKEITEAAKILGVDIRMMDYDDNPLEFNRERFLELVDIIREEKPDIVLTHWINDWLNWDHATTAEWTVRAVWSAARKGILTKSPVHKVKERDFGRIWLIASNWSRDNGLDEPSESVKRHLDHEMTLLLSKNIEGTWIYLYERK